MSLFTLVFAGVAVAGEAETDADVPASACASDPYGELERGMSALWDAYSRLDEVNFDRSSKALAASIACIDYEVPAEQVARIHSAMALAAFINGQVRACRRSLVAVRLFDPTMKLDEELFPMTHPYRSWFDAATDPGPTDELGKIAPKVWIVDGAERPDAPTERAFLLQVRDEGKIVWTGYLWDWVEIPDFGQSSKRSLLESPQQVVVSVLGTGGALSVEQVPEATNPVWSNQQETTFAGGGALAVRVTPVTVVGFEAGGSVVAPSDPVDGGGGLPSGYAVALFGGAGWAGRLQPHVAARLGGGVDRVRSWAKLPEEAVIAGEGSLVELWTVPSAVMGLEFGLRTDRQRVMLSGDAYLAGFRVPYQAKARVTGGTLVAGPLAIEGLGEFRVSSLEFVSGPLEEVQGRRNDLDFRIGAGFGVWL